MDIFATIAEQRIAAAMERGEFDNLPGQGQPLAAEDLSGVPEDLRMAYKVLKNAGCLPPEIELSNEVESLRRLVIALDEGEERSSKARELNYKLMKLEMMRKRPLNLSLLPEYQSRIMDRLTE
ncbi:MAG TPA: DUF1992 domain-containing protein [Deltaproteobacteria bacterium]|nr:DUF1992 domain-containing protein [Deltaproteobacteria bacterium]HQB37673.1 DUF1992 domain-containing protein [Deltaproteobacteria bacterium]